MTTRMGSIALMTAAVLAGFTATASAQMCTAEQLAGAVDQAGAALRRITAESRPRIERQLAELKQKRGWTGAEGDEQAYAEIADARGRALEQTVNELLARVDTLGVLPAGAVPECVRLQELEATGLELQAAVKARTAHIIARLETLLAPARPAEAVAAKSPEPPRAPEPARPAEPPKMADAPKPAPAAKAEPPAWTTTVDAAPVLQAIDDEGFTREDMVRASSGVFGQVSANLASVFEHAFSKMGRPTAYILGSEGGGAFIAGLRYGRGTLYTRNGQSMPIYWHGPSLGMDFGAAGTQVMFLVYRLKDPAELAEPFAALDGSAFVAGGVGLTLMSNNAVQVAPIRSGVGLRLGASVGYVRFSRRPTWNPF